MLSESIYLTMTVQKKSNLREKIKKNKNAFLPNCPLMNIHKYRKHEGLELGEIYINLKCGQGGSSGRRESMKGGKRDVKGYQ